VCSANTSPACSLKDHHELISSWKQRMMTVVTIMQKVIVDDSSGAQKEFSFHLTLLYSDLLFSLRQFDVALGINAKLAMELSTTEGDGDDEYFYFLFCQVLLYYYYNHVFVYVIV
jgi:hypothetical protein